jgi:general secretion pathway protein B
MSYILDALLKADLERQRRAVPGLHTVQLSPPGGIGARGRWLAWTAGALLLALLPYFAWERLGQAPATAAPVKQGESPTAPAEAVPTPAEESRALPEGAALKPALLPAPRREALAGRSEKPDSRLYAIAELPPALQSEARKIAVAGFAQASDAEERMAIINDRALREGDEVTTGLRVERIADDGVIFNLKGYRFRKGGGGA